MQNARVPCVCACTLALRIPLHAPRCVHTFPHALVPAVAGHCGGSDAGRARAHVHVHVLCDLGFTCLVRCPVAYLLRCPLVRPVRRGDPEPAPWGDARGVRLGAGPRAPPSTSSAPVCVCLGGLCHCFCGASLAPRCVRPRGPEFGTARRAPMLDQKGVTGLFVTPFWSKSGARQAVLVSGPLVGPGIGASRWPFLL